MPVKQFIGVAVVLTGLLGCGSDKSTKVKTKGTATTKAASTTAAATLPTVPSKSTPRPESKAPEATARPIGPTSEPATPPSQTPGHAPDIGELFALPKAPDPVVIRAPEPKAEPKPVAKVESPKAAPAMPALRLIGFVELDQLQALLSIDDKLNVLAQGQSVNGVEIAAIDPPKVRIKHNDKEHELDLINEKWVFVGKDAAHGPDRKPSRNPPAPPPGRGPGKPTNSTPARYPDTIPEMPPIFSPPAVGTIPPPPGPSTQPAALPAPPGKNPRPQSNE